MAERTLEQVALTTLTVVQVVNFWDAFLPPLGAMESGGTVSKTSIRRGEMHALGLSLAFGIAASILAREPWPVLGVALMSGYMLYQYEQALTACGQGSLAQDLGKPAPDANRWGVR